MVTCFVNDKRFSRDELARMINSIQDILINDDEFEKVTNIEWVIKDELIRKQEVQING